MVKLEKGLGKKEFYKSRIKRDVILLLNEENHKKLRKNAEEAKDSRAGQTPDKEGIDEDLSSKIQGKIKKIKNVRTRKRGRSRSIFKGK